jgi:hypothetical protein
VYSLQVSCLDEEPEPGCTYIQGEEERIMKTVVGKPLENPDVDMKVCKTYRKEI